MSLADEAARAGLHKVGARPPFWIYLRDVWRRRQFIYRLARYRIEASNGQNRLGMAWVLLKPASSASLRRFRNVSSRCVSASSRCRSRAWSVSIVCC